jgi:hypothetical protein
MLKVPPVLAIAYKLPSLPFTGTEELELASVTSSKAYTTLKTPVLVNL